MFCSFSLIRPFVAVTAKCLPILRVWGGFSALTLLGCLSFAVPAWAAEEVVLTYGPLEAVLSVNDLQALAQTGQASQSLGFYLGIAGVDPAAVRRTLNQSVPVSDAFVAQVSSGQEGDRLLTRMTDVVYASDRQRSVPALRTAILNAAQNDQQITLLELMEHYPQRQMYINGSNIRQVMQELSAAQEVSARF